MKIGYSLTDLKNQVLGKLIDSTELVKGLVIDREDFLTATPNAEQALIISEPDRLLRKQIYPFRRAIIANVTDKPHITTGWYDFKKSGNNFISGTLFFYIVIPNSLLFTDYGLRYDYLGDTLEDLFTECGIGRFEFVTRSDIDVDGNSQGHFVQFKILDFHGRIGE